MTLLKRTLDRIDKGRSDIIHSIPTTIPKYDEFLDGTVQGRYYLIGAESSVGKTTFVRDKHIYTAYEQFKKINDPSKLDVVFVDFSLEMSPEINMAAYMSRKLYLEYGRVIPTKKILKGLDDENRKIIDSYIPYFEDFQKRLIVVDEDLTPSKYHDVLLEVAKLYGKFDKEARWISECGNWTPNNPNLYIIIIVDTINLGETEEEDKTIKSVIDRISRISVWFRNKCNMTPIIIQQFNAEISAVDRSRYGIKTPLLRDFEDSKRGVKDADVVIGLYDPSRHMKEDETMFRGYDITILRQNFRSLHIMKNRYGENNKFIPLAFKGAVGLFEQLPEPSLMDEKEYTKAIKL